MAKKISSPITVTADQFADENYMQDLEDKFRESIKTEGGKNIRITTKILGKTTIDIKNPIESAGRKDAFRLSSTPKQYYLRFGYLLEYINENVTPRVKVGDDHNSNPQMFKINFDQWKNYMYSLPNQISLDPRVCIVRNSNFYTGNPKKNTQIFQELLIFRQVDNGKAKQNSNLAYSMNIYLNFDFILECLKPDDRGNVSIFEFLSSICTGLNKALGGINNLEPVIDEDTNILSILDTTPIPGVTSRNNSNYVLQIYGYDKIGNNYISNFVRNVDLKTAITPEFATMITVGATAGGYVKGTEATAFSKWNNGLRDRFKEDLTPGNINSLQSAGSDNEAEVNYAEEFASSNAYITRYGLTGLSNTFKLNLDAIERNLSVVTEYYKYILNKESKDQPTAGGTIGFIPFKLSLTLDGISGIKIYNKLSINTEFLPKVYGRTADLIVTGVSHTLSNNDWTTQIETTLIPKTGKQSTAVILPQVIEKSITNASKSPKPDRWPYYSDSDAVPLDIEAPSKGTPPNYNASVSFSSEIKTEYYPILKTLTGKTKGLKLLALVMSQKEGFYKGSRSYRANNPGNIGNTDSGGNVKFDNLKTGILKQLNYLSGVAKGTNGNYPLNSFKDIKPYYSPEIDANKSTYNLTPYLPGYKFKYTGTLEQFVKIYSTGARGGNSYLSIIISFFRKNGFNNVTEKTKLSDLIKLNNSDPIIL